MLTPPSGSLGMADTSLPTWGCLWDRNTSPASSVSTTSMVTSRVVDRPPERAVMVIEYELFVFVVRRVGLVDFRGIRVVVHEREPIGGR